MQTAQIIGNIGRDIVVRHTQSGKEVASVGVGVTVKKDGPTIWWDCSVWGEEAMRFAESINKGDRLLLSGPITFEMRKDSRTDTLVMQPKMSVKHWQVVNRSRQVEIVAEGAETPTTENLDAAFAAAGSSVDTPPATEAEPDDIPF